MTCQKLLIKNDITQMESFTGHILPVSPTERLDKMAGCDWLATPNPVGSNGEI